MYAILSSFNKNIYEWSLRLLISPIVTHSHRPSFYAFKHFYRLHFNVKHASKNELKLQTECEETGGLTLWSLLRCPEHREHLFFLPGRWVMGTRWEQWQWRACVCFLHCKCPLVCLHTWTAPAFPMPTAPPAGVKSNVSRWNSAVQAMKETTVGYPPLMWNCITFAELFQYLILSLYSLSYMLGLTLTVSMGLLLNNCAISKCSCRLTCLHVLLAVLSG